MINITTMNLWFSELTTIEKIYWIIAIAASIFFIIQMISTFTLGDLDVQVAGDTDIDIEMDDGIPYQFFTLRNLVAFFTIFGWVGIACLSADYPVVKTIIISAISGFAMMFVMTTLFYFISRLTDSGNLNIDNAVGKMATIYIPVKAKRSNMGKVQIKIQGSLHELDAITDEEIDLATGSVVKVKAVLDNNILIVEKN